MLLSFDEYKELGGVKVTDENKYKLLESNTEDLFNARTGGFYIDNDINQDTDARRVKYFKKAMQLQIDFANDVGASTIYELADLSVHSVSIDGTTVSTDKKASDETRKGIYTLAWQYLLQTGLLYRGVGIYD